MKRGSIIIISLLTPSTAAYRVQDPRYEKNEQKQRQAELPRKIRNSGVVVLKLVWNVPTLK